MDVLFIVNLWLGFAIAVSVAWLVVVLLDYRRIAKKREEV